MKVQLLTKQILGNDLSTLSKFLDWSKLISADISSFSTLSKLKRTIQHNVWNQLAYPAQVAHGLIIFKILLSFKCVLTKKSENALSNRVLCLFAATTLKTKNFIECFFWKETVLQTFTCGQ